MSNLRVLIVDDSAVSRKLLGAAVSNDADLKLAGSAASGAAAIKLIPRINPDVVTLDLEMPEMGGMQTLAWIRAHYPRLPVVMISSHTQRGAARTFEALAQGALGYLEKPQAESWEASLQVLNVTLPAKLKEVCARADRWDRRRPRTAHSSRASGPPRLIAIGSSMGGPDALAQVLEGLPADFPVPIVIVQHIPENFTLHLVERLARSCALSVTKAEEGEALVQGMVRVAPGDQHLRVKRAGERLVVALSYGPKESGCRPSVDVLFRSVADAVGAQALGLVLTGMGQDGVQGSHRLREVGAQVWAQDDESAVARGMPAAVAQAGAAQQTLSLAQIAKELQRLQGSAPWS